MSRLLQPLLSPRLLFKPRFQSFSLKQNLNIASPSSPRLSSPFILLPLILLLLDNHTLHLPLLFPPPLFPHMFLPLAISSSSSSYSPISSPHRRPLPSPNSPLGHEFDVGIDLDGRVGVRPVRLSPEAPRDVHYGVSQVARAVSHLEEGRQLEGHNSDISSMPVSWLELRSEKGHRDIVKGRL